MSMTVTMADLFTPRARRVPRKVPPARHCPACQQAAATDLAARFNGNGGPLLGPLARSGDRPQPTCPDHTR